MKAKNNHKSQASHLLISAVAVILIAAAISYLIVYLGYRRNYQDTNDAQVESYINPVSARAGGYIQHVRFEEHQAVKQGDTLVVLDNREYLAQLQIAQATMDDAKAQLEVLSASIRSAKTATRVNIDQISGAKARFVQQNLDIKRYERLVREEAATGADLEQVRARFDVSQSDLSAARNTLNTSVARIAELNTHYALLQADIKRKEAALQLAKLNLSYTIIRAPYSGRLGKKNIMEGQQIQAGQPLVNIIDDKQKWIIANFKETQLGDMYIGQSVEITPDAMTGEVLKGRISAIAGSTGSRSALLPTDNATGNFVKIIQRVSVKIVFEGKATQVLVAGMNVSVAIKKKNHENHLL